MDLPERYRAPVAEAREAAAGGDWEAVAALMAGVCEQALEAGELAVARSAAAGEADALRRAERPAAAIGAIRRALDLADDPHVQVVQELQLVAVLLDTGRLDLAELVARERVAACPAGPLRALSIDSLCGVLLARGDVAGLAGVLRQLDGEAEGAMGVAAHFRRAQLDRLAGRLEESAAGFGRCMSELEDRPGADGAWAAACSGLAGVALLRGDAEDAMPLYDRAAAAWRRAGRRGGALRVLSGRARAALQLGASTFLPSLLDDGLRFAGERHLTMLEIELLATRALCRRAAGLEARAREDMARALRLAEGAGASLLAGRCRYELSLLGGAADLRAAVLELTEDRPWCARAMTALSASTEDPDEAAELAGAAVCRFSAMGMKPDVELARALLGRSAR